MTTKARILRILPRCSSEHRQQLMDLLHVAETLAPETPPPPVLLLEHCRGLANLLHTCQLATAYNLNNAMFSHTGADD